MDIIKEYKVEGSHLAVMSEAQAFGPVEDGATHLKALGAVPARDVYVGYVETWDGRSGDWPFGTFQGVTGPFVIVPKGYDVDQNEPKLRVFSTENLEKLDDLK